MPLVVPQWGTVAVDGASLRYRMEGAGPPMLVIGSATYYPRTFSCPLRNHFRMVFMDLRHFAATEATPRSRKATLMTYLDDIERARRHLGLKRVLLVGHSHHGNVALAYAKRFPEHVFGLVLIGTPPCDVAATMAAAETYWEQAASPTRKQILGQRRAALPVETLEAMAPAQAFVAEYVVDGPRYWFDPHYDASWLWRDVPIDMEQISAFRHFFADYKMRLDPLLMPAPVLVVMGRHDYAVPHTLWDAIRPAMDTVSYHLLDNSGHTPQLEQAALFDQLLLAWMRTV